MPDWLRCTYAGGIWALLDVAGHALKVPDKAFGVPLMRIVCDRYDVALGVPQADVVEMDYNGKPPWWLRG